MCGLAAILLQPQARSPQVWAALRANFTANLLFNEVRGQQATGVALFQADGRVQLLKHPIPAQEFVQTAAYQELLQAMGPQTTLIMGHTRLPTKGSPGNNDNNHPIQVGDVYGIHNGHIKNDDDLFDQCGCVRQAEVDSEIIFQLLNHEVPVALSEGTLTAVAPIVAQLKGDFTFLATDRRCPHKLLVVKHRNPLSLHYQPEWGALFFASRYIFLRKTFGRVVLNERLPRDQLMIYDAYALAEVGHQPLITQTLYLT